MANSQTFGGGDASTGQITTLANVVGSGLTLPAPPQQFINIRKSGKLRELFENNGNDNVIYSLNKPEDVGLADALKNRFQYKNPNQGQRDRKITNLTRAAAQDANLVRSFLRSKNGTRFITNQLLLQGFQAFDETKVYNPLSPYIASLKPASFGFLDSPTRHIDTGNVIGGLVNGLGIGKITSTIGGLFGKAPPQPAPPRSSVASEASGGFGLATFTSLLGGGDRTSEVVTPLARNDVKDLLRGGTATNAYNAPRYSKLVDQGSGGGFFKKLLSGVGKFIQNNTAIGGLIPPKQPWDAKYRADEETYDLYLNAGKLFSPEQTGIEGGGILSGILNSIGFGKKSNYSQAVRQRFHGTSKQSPDGNRLVITKNIGRPSVNDITYTFTNQVGTITGPTKISGKDIQEVPVNSGYDSQNSRLRYGDSVGSRMTNNVNEEIEQSDQLLNYKALVNNTKDYKGTFTNDQDVRVENLIQNFNDALTDISGPGNTKYDVGFSSKKNLYPLQFAKFSNDPASGMDFVNEIDPSKKNSPYADNRTYQARLRRDESKANKIPSRLGELSTHDRYIRPTNNVDYVNALNVMNSQEFKKYYSETETFGIYGPDLIKFYFYDIVNKKFIPFNATVKGISDQNQAEWETISYIGRADKLYYYKGFTRSVSFNFKTVAHSIKELRPMWQRINYLTGLTKPANYTMNNYGGYMVSPMVQLTLGDFYKNHNVVIDSVNITIPDDAAWELTPEDTPTYRSWYYGLNQAISWSSSKNLLNGSVDTRQGNSKARVAQFPREAEISVSMKVLEKDLPKTGRAIWGDAPVERITLDKYLEYANSEGIPVNKELLKQGGVTMVDTYTSDSESISAGTGDDIKNIDRFSTWVRYENGLQVTGPPTTLKQVKTPESEARMNILKNRMTTLPTSQ